MKSRVRGKSSGIWTEGSSLRKEEKRGLTESHSPEQGAVDGPKGQERMGNTVRATLQKGYALGAGRTGTKNPGIRTRHKDSRIHGTRQND